MHDAVSLPHCNSFWDKPELTPLAAACLHSFVEVGHSVTLYAYDFVRNAPPGVAQADAATVLPRKLMSPHKRSDSSAPFSDRFRYELLRLGRGIWIDCDLLCLKPIATPAKHLFGWQTDEIINNAVLGIPADSPLLEDLRSIFTTHWAPPWYSPFRRLRYKLKYWLIPGFGFDYMPLNFTGPIGLTHYARHRGLHVHAVPPQVFYPVPCAEAGAFVNPRCDIARYLSDESTCIHLWNSQLTCAMAASPPVKSSFVTRVVEGSWRESIGR